MSREIELKEFDAPLNKHRHDIHKVQALIESAMEEVVQKVVCNASHL